MVGFFELLPPLKVRYTDSEGLLELGSKGGSKNDQTASFWSGAGTVYFMAGSRAGYLADLTKTPNCAVYSVDCNLHVHTCTFREKVSDKNVRPIDSGLAAVPPQALMCSLAYIKVSGICNLVGHKPTWIGAEHVQVEDAWNKAAS